LLVGAAGFGLAFESWQLLRQVLFACSENLPASPGMLALAACLASIVSKEALYRATDVVGRRLNSPVIIANAKHHRSDVWSSVVAIVGVIGARFGQPILDPIAALVVAGMVLKMGAGVAVDALGQLTDTTDDAIVAAVKRAARGVASVAKVPGARARAAGSSWLVEVEVMPDMFVVSASAMDHLAARVQRAVLDAVADVKECLVRVHTGAFQRHAADQLPTPRDIDRHVRETLAHAPGSPGVSRVVAHFTERKPSVEVWVDVPRHRTLSEGAATAAAARDALLASELGFDVVQIHVELSSGGGGGG